MHTGSIIYHRTQSKTPFMNLETSEKFLQTGKIRSIRLLKQRSVECKIYQLFLSAILNLQVPENAAY